MSRRVDTLGGEEYRRLTAAEYAAAERGYRATARVNRYYSHWWWLGWDARAADMALGAYLMECGWSPIRDASR